MPCTMHVVMLSGAVLCLYGCLPIPILDLCGAADFFLFLKGGLALVDVGQCDQLVEIHVVGTHR